MARKQKTIETETEEKKYELFLKLLDTNEKIIYLEITPKGFKIEDEVKISNFLREYFKNINEKGYILNKGTAETLLEKLQKEARLLNQASERNEKSIKKLEDTIKKYEETIPAIFKKIFK